MIKSTSNCPTQHRTTPLFRRHDTDQSVIVRVESTSLGRWVEVGLVRALLDQIDGFHPIDRGIAAFMKDGNAICCGLRLAFDHLRDPFGHKDRRRHRVT